MKRDKIWYILIAGIIAMIGTGVFLWNYQSDQVEKTMTEEAFSQLKNKEMEVVDTGVFLDEELENWYYKNRQVAGEYVYPSGDSTYILVSVGEVEKENTFLLLNGVKDIDGKLAIGYGTLVMNDVPDIEFEDSIRSTLVKVQGNYADIQAIDVQEYTPPS